MAEQYTPGPWEVEAGKVVAPEQPKRVWGENKQYSGNFIVCQPHLYVSSDRAAQEANAQLISAAPDLLDALERLVHMAECNTTPGPNTLAQARAAIAKARGEA